jgi:DNA-binding CsgD family transcriptional regulator
LLSAVIAATGVTGLVGRGHERRVVDELLGRARGGRSGALVVRGEAGIGKTALLEYAVERAEGMTMVRALGVESEAELQFSGLLELLRPLLDHLDQIPLQQAEALRSALGLGEPEAHDRFTIGAASLSLLAAAAESNPLLVLVDDAQWLDCATKDALLFSTRRLVADSAAILFAVREGEGRGFDPPGIERLELGGLGSDEAVRLLAGGERDVTPDVVDRLWEATRGNPLALLEAQSLLTGEQLAGREPLPEPVPTGATLERAFARRAETLPPDSQHALVVAAVSLSTELEAVATALATLGIERVALEEVEDAGLISIADGRIAFRHPLVRSAVFHGSPPSERRVAHRALAEAMRDRGDPERWAWHLAWAALGEDEEAAAALELAARQASARSSFAAAAAAMERAASLTGDEKGRLPRLYAAADAALHAGRPDDAVALLAAPLESGAEPCLKAEALRLQGRIEYLAGRPRAASDLLLEASTLLEDVDRPLAVKICIEACNARLGVGDAAGMLAAAERAHTIAAETHDEAVSRLVAQTLGWVLCYVGRSPEGTPLLERSAASPEHLGVQLEPLSLVRIGVALEWLERSREAFRYAGRDVDRARANGAVGLLPYLLFQQAWHANRAGLLSEGYAAASEALGLAREMDLWLPRVQALLVLASITSKRGAERECRAYADELEGPLDEAGLHGYRVWLRQSLGLLELGLGRLDEAAYELEAAGRGLEELGIHSRVIVPRSELVEVYARAGRVDEAAEPLADVGKSLECQSPVGLAGVARGRGLLASDDEFEGWFEQAFAEHDRSDDRWALARTRLAFGERLRRAARRVESREQLRLALEAFEEMGADAWAERARAELRASGEKLRRRQAWEGEELTPQELQIALHVARGMTNREVGAALFLSHKTIEFHLGRIYRKLNMRSRSELIRRFAAGAQVPEPQPLASWKDRGLP